MAATYIDYTAFGGRGLQTRDFKHYSVRYDRAKDNEHTDSYRSPRVPSLTSVFVNPIVLWRQVDSIYQLSKYSSNLVHNKGLYDLLAKLATQSGFGDQWFKDHKIEIKENVCYDYYYHKWIHVIRQCLQKYLAKPRDQSPVAEIAILCEMIAMLGHDDFITGDDIYQPLHKDVYGDTSSDRESIEIDETSREYNNAARSVFTHARKCFRNWAIREKRNNVSEAYVEPIDETRMKLFVESLVRFDEAWREFYSKHGTDAFSVMVYRQSPQQRAYADAVMHEIVLPVYERRDKKGRDTSSVALWELSSRAWENTPAWLKFKESVWNVLVTVSNTSELYFSPGIITKKEANTRLHDIISKTTQYTQAYTRTFRCVELAVIMLFLSDYQKAYSKFAVDVCIGLCIENTPLGKELESRIEYVAFSDKLNKNYHEELLEISKSNPIGAALVVISMLTRSNYKRDQIWEPASGTNYNSLFDELNSDLGAILGGGSPVKVLAALFSDFQWTWGEYSEEYVKQKSGTSAGKKETDAQEILLKRSVDVVRLNIYKDPVTRTVSHYQRLYSLFAQAYLRKSVSDVYDRSQYIINHSCWNSENPYPKRTEEKNPKKEYPTIYDKGKSDEVKKSGFVTDVYFLPETLEEMTARYKTPLVSVQDSMRVQDRDLSPRERQARWLQADLPYLVPLQYVEAASIKEEPVYKIMQYRPLLQLPMNATYKTITVSFRHENDGLPENKPEQNIKLVTPESVFDNVELMNNIVEYRSTIALWYYPGDDMNNDNKVMYISENPSNLYYKLTGDQTDIVPEQQRDAALSRRSIFNVLFGEMKNAKAEHLSVSFGRDGSHCVYLTLGADGKLAAETEEGDDTGTRFDYLANTVLFLKSGGGTTEVIRPDKGKYNSYTFEGRRGYVARGAIWKYAKDEIKNGYMCVFKPGNSPPIVYHIKEGNLSICDVNEPFLDMSSANVDAWQRATIYDEKSGGTAGAAEMSNFVKSSEYSITTTNGEKYTLNLKTLLAIRGNLSHWAKEVLLFIYMNQYFTSDDGDDGKKLLRVTKSNDQVIFYRISHASIRYKPVPNLEDTDISPDMLKLMAEQGARVEGNVFSVTVGGVIPTIKVLFEFSWNDGPDVSLKKSGTNVPNVAKTRLFRYLKANVGAELEDGTLGFLQLRDKRKVSRNYSMIFTSTGQWEDLPNGLTPIITKSLSSITGGSVPETIKVYNSTINSGNTTWTMTDDASVYIGGHSVYQSCLWNVIRRILRSENITPTPDGENIDIALLCTMEDRNQLLYYTNDTFKLPGVATDDISSILKVFPVKEGRVVTIYSNMEELLSGSSSGNTWKYTKGVVSYKNDAVVVHPNQLNLLLSVSMVSENSKCVCVSLETGVVLTRTSDRYEMSTFFESDAHLVQSEYINKIKTATITMVDSITSDTNPVTIDVNEKYVSYTSKSPTNTTVSVPRDFIYDVIIQTAKDKLTQNEGNGKYSLDIWPKSGAQTVVDRKQETGELRPMTVIFEMGKNLPPFGEYSNMVYKFEELRVTKKEAAKFDKWPLLAREAFSLTGISVTMTFTGLQKLNDGGVYGFKIGFVGGQSMATITTRSDSGGTTTTKEQTLSRDAVFYTYLPSLHGDFNKIAVTKGTENDGSGWSDVILEGNAVKWITLRFSADSYPDDFMYLNVNPGTGMSAPSMYRTSSPYVDDSSLSSTMGKFPVLSSSDYPYTVKLMPGTSAFVYATYARLNGLYIPVADVWYYIYFDVIKKYIDTKVLTNNDGDIKAYWDLFKTLSFSVTTAPGIQFQWYIVKYDTKGCEMSESVGFTMDGLPAGYRISPYLRTLMPMLQVKGTEKSTRQGKKYVLCEVDTSIDKLSKQKGDLKWMCCPVSDTSGSIPHYYHYAMALISVLGATSDLNTRLKYGLSGGWISKDHEDKLTLFTMSDKAGLVFFLKNVSTPKVTVMPESALISACAPLNREMREIIQASSLTDGSVEMYAWYDTDRKYISFELFSFYTLAGTNTIRFTFNPLYTGAKGNIGFTDFVKNVLGNVRSIDIPKSCLAWVIQYFLYHMLAGGVVISNMVSNTGVLMRDDSIETEMGMVDSAGTSAAIFKDNRMVELSEYVRGYPITDYKHFPDFDNRDGALVLNDGTTLFDVINMYKKQKKGITDGIIVTGDDNGNRYRISLFGSCGIFFFLKEGGKRVVYMAVLRNSDNVLLKYPVYFYDTQNSQYTRGTDYNVVLFEKTYNFKESTRGYGISLNTDYEQPRKKTRTLVVNSMEIDEDDTKVVRTQSPPQRSSAYKLPRNNRSAGKKKSEATTLSKYKRGLAGKPASLLEKPYMSASSDVEEHGMEVEGQMQTISRELNLVDSLYAYLEVVRHGGIDSEEMEPKYYHVLILLVAALVEQKIETGEIDPGTNDQQSIFINEILLFWDKYTQGYLLARMAQIDIEIWRLFYKMYIVGSPYEQQGASLSAFLTRYHKTEDTDPPISRNDILKHIAIDITEQLLQTKMFERNYNGMQRGGIIHLATQKDLENSTNDWYERYIKHIMYNAANLLSQYNKAKAKREIKVQELLEQVHTLKQDLEVKRDTVRKMEVEYRKTEEEAVKRTKYESDSGSADDVDDNEFHDALDPEKLQSDLEEARNVIRLQSERIDSLQAEIEEDDRDTIDNGSKVTNIFNTLATVFTPESSTPRSKKKKTSHSSASDASDGSNENLIQEIRQLKASLEEARSELKRERDRMLVTRDELSPSQKQTIEAQIQGRIDQVSAVYRDKIGQLEQEIGVKTRLLTETETIQAQLNAAVVSYQETARRYITNILTIVSGYSSVEVPDNLDAQFKLLADVLVARDTEYTTIIQRLSSQRDQLAQNYASKEEELTRQYSALLQEQQEAIEAAKSNATRTVKSQSAESVNMEQDVSVSMNNMRLKLNETVKRAEKLQAQLDKSSSKGKNISRKASDVDRFIVSASMPNVETKACYLEYDNNTFTYVHNDVIIRGDDEIQRVVVQGVDSFSLSVVKSHSVAMYQLACDNGSSVAVFTEYNTDGTVKGIKRLPRASCLDEIINNIPEGVPILYRHRGILKGCCFVEGSENEYHVVKFKPKEKQDVLSNGVWDTMTIISIDEYTQTMSTVIVVTSDGICVRQFDVNGDAVLNPNLYMYPPGYQSAALGSYMSAGVIQKQNTVLYQLNSTSTQYTINLLGEIVPFDDVSDLSVSLFAHFKKAAGLYWVAIRSINLDKSTLIFNNTNISGTSPDDDFAVFVTSSIMQIYFGGKRIIVPVRVGVTILVKYFIKTLQDKNSKMYVCVYQYTTGVSPWYWLDHPSTFTDHASLLGHADMLNKELKWEFQEADIAKLSTGSYYVNTQGMLNATSKVDIKYVTVMKQMVVVHLSDNEIHYLTFLDLAIWLSRVSSFTGAMPIALVKVDTHNTYIGNLLRDVNKIANRDQVLEKGYVVESFSIVATFSRTKGVQTELMEGITDLFNSQTSVFMQQNIFEIRNKAVVGNPKIYRDTFLPYLLHTLQLYGSGDESPLKKGGIIFKLNAEELLVYYSNQLFRIQTQNNYRVLMALLTRIQYDTSDLLETDMMASGEFVSVNVEQTILIRYQSVSQQVSVNDKRYGDNAMAMNMFCSSDREFSFYYGLCVSGYHIQSTV